MNIEMTHEQVKKKMREDIKADDKMLKLKDERDEWLEEAEKLINLHVKAMNGKHIDLVQWDSAVLNLRSAIAKVKGEQE